jgi:hypothetical protein
MSIPALRARYVAGLALLTIAALGCRGRTAPQPESMTLTVDNRSGFQVNVFAVPSLPAARIRLGSVSPLSTGELRLTQAALGAGGELKVMVDPIGSTNEWMSGSVTVASGTQPCLRVMADVDGDLGRSTLYTQVGNGGTCP